MSQPRQVRAAPREVALVLLAPTVAHNRRRAAQAESGGDAPRASKVPENQPCLQLLDASEVRSEKRLFLPSHERGSHQVLGQKQGSSVPPDGGQVQQIAPGK